MELLRMEKTTEVTQCPNANPVPLCPLCASGCEKCLRKDCMTNTAGHIGDTT